VYQDPALTIPIEQPFSTDANGNFAFFAASSTVGVPATQYHAQIQGIGLTPYDIPYIFIPGGGGSAGTPPGGLNGQLQYNISGTSFGGLPCLWTGSPTNSLVCNPVTLTVSGGLGIGPTTPAACGSAQDCIAFFQNAVAGNPTAGENYFYATSTGWNCDINAGSEFPCVSNGMPVLNVKALGATAAGYPTDDRTTIQGIINSCPQVGTYKGCIVFFPAGNYYVSSPGLTNGAGSTYHGVRLVGDGTAGRSGSTSTIETNGTGYYAFSAGVPTAGNAYGLQIDQLGFTDESSTGQGAIYVAGMTDGAFTNLVCNNFYVGVCITADGGVGVDQYQNLTNIYTWHTRTRLQTVHRTASITVFGGEGNCQNSASTDVIPNSYDLDIGYTRQVSGAGTVNTVGTAITIASFTSGFGSLTQDYVNAPIVINGVTYTILAVTGASTATLTATAGTQTGVAWSITGQGGTGEYAITSASQNCQVGRAIFNAGGMKFQGDKASEQTILYRPTGSFGVIVAGDSPTLTNNNTFIGEQVTASGTGIWIGKNAQNTSIISQTGDGTNGMDLAIDATAFTTTHLDPTFRYSGWTTNLATISRSGNLVTATTTPNLLTNNPGNLSIIPGALVTVYGVTGGTTSFNGTFATTALTGVSCNDTTDVCTLTWAQTGANESGSINTTACVGGSGGSCIAALSSILSTSTGLGVLEQTGASVVTDVVLQQMRVPPQQIMPLTTIAGTARYFYDGSFWDIIYGNPGYGVLHLSDGPLVGNGNNSSQYYQPQPTQTNSEVACTTAVSVSTQANVCQSSDDKGYQGFSAPNGTTVCLPALPDPGFPPGFSVTLAYVPGSGNNFLALVPPGQASPYGAITCPGATGTTYMGSTAVVKIWPQQSLKIRTNPIGTEWLGESGNQTYVPPLTTVLPFEHCTPDTSGFVSLTTPITFTNWFATAWEFQPSHTYGMFCDVMIPTTLTPGSTAQVLLYIAANDATAGHTANFQSSDVAVAATSGNLQVGTLTSSSALPYTTTSTAYQQVLLTFAVNSSLSAGQKLIVKIGTSGTGTPPAANMIVYPYLQLSQNF
jgi:hypothetical protein